MTWMLIGSLAGGFAGIIIYIYYMQKGQFDNLEEVKYQLFREDTNKIEPKDK